MDIACPHCAAAYRVPDALVMRRKPVRCAACGHRWVPDLPAGAEAAPLAPEVPPAAPPVSDVPAPPDSMDTAPAGVSEAAPAIPVEDADAPHFAEAPHVADPTDAAPAPETLTDTGALTPKPATPPPLAQPRGILSSAPRRARGAALLPMAWAVSIGAVAGLILLLWVFRLGIAQAWPPFGRVVLLLGG